MKNKVVRLCVVAVMFCMAAAMLTGCKKKDKDEEIGTESVTEIVEYVPYEGFVGDTLCADTPYPITPFQRVDGRLELRVADAGDINWEYDVPEELVMDSGYPSSEPREVLVFALSRKEDAKENKYHFTMSNAVVGWQYEMDLQADEETGLLLIEQASSKQIDRDLNKVEGYTENKALVDKVPITSGDLYYVGEGEFGLGDSGVATTTLNYQFGDESKTVMVAGQNTFEELTKATESEMENEDEIRQQECEVEGQKVIVYSYRGTIYCIWEKNQLPFLYYYYVEDDFMNLDEAAKAVADFMK